MNGMLFIVLAKLAAYRSVSATLRHAKNKTGKSKAALTNPEINGRAGYTWVAIAAEGNG